MSSAEVGSTSRAGLSPASRVLVTLAAAAITIAGLWLARGVIGTVAIAALVVMVAHPLRHRLGQPDRAGIAVGPHHRSVAEPLHPRQSACRAVPLGPGQMTCHH